MQLALRGKHALSANVDLDLDVLGHIPDLDVSVHVHVHIAHDQIVRGVVRSLKKNVVVRLLQNDVVEAHCTKLK